MSTILRSRNGLVTKCPQVSISPKSPFLERPGRGFDNVRVVRVPAAFPPSVPNDPVGHMEIDLHCLLISGRTIFTFFTDGENRFAGRLSVTALSA
jgi:hypothetical protein